MSNNNKQNKRPQVYQIASWSGHITQLEKEMKKKKGPRHRQGGGTTAESGSKGLFHLPRRNAKETERSESRRELRLAATEATEATEKQEVIGENKKNPR